MKLTLISIIVPCYNVEKYIQKCVESILHQTYTNWELILVDDGSTDQTPVLCDNFAKRQSRIKVIHQKNGGLVSARNTGYKAATGDWIMYIDGDDWIDTNTCEVLIRYLEKYPDVDIIFWKCIQELETNSIKGKWEWKCSEQEHLYVEDECHELARHTLIYKSGIATAYCKLIRADYAKAYGIFHDDRLRQGAEGLEFSLRAFYYAKKALYVNEYFNHYRYNPDSISKQVNEKNTTYLTECFQVIEEDIEGFQQKERFMEVLYQRIVYVLIAIAMSTYFHPKNRDSIPLKIKKYKAVIKHTPLFQTAIQNSGIMGMDKLRQITFLFIRWRMYFMLPIVSFLKQYYLKRGKYNY